MVMEHLPSQSFVELLEKIRNVTELRQQRGQIFERLIKAFLLTDPIQKERFKKVSLWMEWEGRGDETDTGIDLVGEDHDGKLCAIQCKFYSENHTIGRGDIDSFLVRSGTDEFSSRLFIATCPWGDNAENVINSQQIPVQRIGISELAKSPIDWTRFDPEHPDQLFLSKTPKEVRPHQIKALEAVKEGLAKADKGTLVMACGTGKTLTALRIAEDMVPNGGTVLYLVPSISLLSQTLRSWAYDAKRPLHSMVVCSDAQVSKSNEDIHIYDLALPATTDPGKLIHNFEIAQKRAKEHNQSNSLFVIFSTYQSLDQVGSAQKQGLRQFDLVVADEAHRTTGAHIRGEQLSNFTLIHDQENLKATKRLFMTATPRVYGDTAKKKAEDESIAICSMDDKSLYGEVLYELRFGKAVEDGLLSDYKVMILAVDAAYANRELYQHIVKQDNSLPVGDAAKLIGCWRGLSKIGDREEFADNRDPMKRAVSFANTISASKKTADMLADIAKTMREKDNQGVELIAEHVDGSMGALKRNKAIDNLESEPPETTCRVLSNARCLSEGVDVPALDAIIFMQPRNSQIDVVQAVGRVMRKAEGKKNGYIILPIVIPEGADPKSMLDNNKEYKVVWEVLNALKSHDDRLNAEINKLDLGVETPRIQVIGVGGDEWSDTDKTNIQQELDLKFKELEGAIYAKIVKKVGNKKHWKDWAQDVAGIVAAHTTRINEALDKNLNTKQAFDKYLESLKKNINPSITKEDAIDMLAQHLVTIPVFEALFGNNEFSKQNPVSEAMNSILSVMDKQEAIENEREELSDFYESVKQRIKGVDTVEGRQTIIKELYGEFFEKAFSKMADRLGIVYTPIEIVDFIIKSVDDALQEEFEETHLGSQGVHILDPFTGTGTFITRLLQSLQPKDLETCYVEYLHANEIVLLAYYIATINIEQTYQALMKDGAYQPFPGIILTDTFQLGEEGNQLELEYLRQNSERANDQKGLPITVILGNPPYSVGQKSENDNNQNLAYDYLDNSIRNTYAAKSSATRKGGLYDSYIRAFRWATDRIGEKNGIVCFVTNGSFIDSNTADGFRKELIKDFSTIYCLNLRGNARTSAEQRQKEKGNVFREGSRTPIAVTLLVKKQDDKSDAKIYYHDIGDYLSSTEKLGKLKSFGSIKGVTWEEIQPNEHGDWINHRSDIFSTFSSLGDKKNKADYSVFSTYSLGLVSNRDAWVYNFSPKAIEKNMTSCIAYYNQERERLKERTDLSKKNIDNFIDLDPKKISWTRSIKNDLLHHKEAAYEPSHIVQSMYRPFCKQWLYFDRQWNEMVHLIPSVFPTEKHKNKVIAVSGIGDKVFSTFITDVIPDLHLVATTQCFPRYYYKEPQAGTMFGENDNWERKDAISEEVLDKYRKQFGDEVSADDVFYYVYGLLHSRDYVSRFSADLLKMLPRIPMAEDFWSFSKAGKDLEEIHLNYENIEPWALEGMPDESATEKELRVEKMRFLNKNDRSGIIVNRYITLSGIPEEAHQYKINSKSGLEWLIDRYQVRTNKDSEIKNDPNTWSSDPRYIVDLIARVVSVSVKSVEIINALPELRIIGKEPE